MNAGWGVGKAQSFGSTCAYNEAIVEEHSTVPTITHAWILMLCTRKDVVDLSHDGMKKKKLCSYFQ